jgi:hypothetical protein
MLQRRTHGTQRQEIIVVHVHAECESLEGKAEVAQTTNEIWGAMAVAEVESGQLLALCQTRQHTNVQAEPIHAQGVSSAEAEAKVQAIQVLERSQMLENARCVMRGVANQLGFVHFGAPVHCRPKFGRCKCGIVFPQDGTDAWVPGERKAARSQNLVARLSKAKVLLPIEELSNVADQVRGQTSGYPARLGFCLGGAIRVKALLVICKELQGSAALLLWCVESSPLARARCYLGFSAAFARWRGRGRFALLGGLLHSVILKSPTPTEVVA